MENAPARPSFWLSYCDADSKHFTHVQHERNVAYDEQSSVDIDCRLHQSSRWFTESDVAATGEDQRGIIQRQKDLAALSFALSTSQRSGTRLSCATLDLHISRRSEGNVSQHMEPLRIVETHPSPALKGEPKTKQKSRDVSFQPEVSVGGSLSLSLGGMVNSAQMETSESWTFHTFMRPGDGQGSVYTCLRLQLKAEGPRSAESLCSRPIDAAAKLEFVSRKIGIRSHVEMKTSSLMSALRIWRSHIHRKRGLMQRVDLGCRPPSPLETNVKQHGSLQLCVQQRNDDYVPRKMPDVQSSGVTALPDVQSPGIERGSEPSAMVLQGAAEAMKTMALVNEPGA